MTRKNPFNLSLDYLTADMERIGEIIEQEAEDVEPFDSQQLTVEQEELLWNNPISLFPGELDPETNMPLTNVRAAQGLHALFGDGEYVKWVESVYERAQARYKYASEE